MSDLESRVAMLERMLAAALRRQGQSVAFGRTTAAPNDAGPVQTVQGRTDALTVKDGMPVLMHYGYHAVMPIGADKVVLFGNADRSSGVVIATGHQTYRPTGWNLGETGLYDMWGHSIRMQQGAILVTGDLHVTGAVIAGYGGVDQVGVQTHKHTQPTDSHGDTEAPTNAPTAGT